MRDDEGREGRRTDVGYDKGNGPVPEPVRGGSEGHSFSTKLERVEFRDQNPGGRSPVES